jgi:hypothetical protein
MNATHFETLPDPPSDTGTGTGSTAVNLDLQQLERSFEEANQRLNRAITDTHELVINKRASEIHPDARSELASARSAVLELAAEAQRMGSQIPAILRWAFLASRNLNWDDSII